MITFLVPRAALALLLTLASWVPLGPNEGFKGRLYAFAPGLPMRQSLCPHAILARAPVSGDWLPLPSCRCLWASGACPVASACLTAAVSWCKQNVDTTRIPPGRVPSGRPIECTLACWVPLGPNKGCIGRPYAFAPGLPTRQSLCPPVIFARSWRNFSCSKRKHDVDATSTPPGREPPGRPIASTVPHLLIDSRPGPKSGVECRLTILLLLLHCQVFHSVRVPALSVGAGEGNLLAHQRRLEVPKLNGDQVTDGKQVPTHLWNPCVKRSFARACNRAIRHGQALFLYLCTFRFLQIPEECLAADLSALSRMLTESRRRQPTPSLDGMARTGTRPHVCFEMRFGF